MPSTPKHMQQPFSKGPPAANLRSSTTRSRLNKSSPTTPPDPDSPVSNNHLSQSTPPFSSTTINHSSNRPSSSTSHQPSSIIHPSTPNQRSLHSSSPTYHSSPSHHPTYQQRITQERIDHMGNHLNQVQDNMINMADNISDVTHTISKLETVIVSMSSAIDKLIPNDDNKQSSTEVTSPSQSHHQSHIRNNHSPPIVENDNDIRGNFLTAPGYVHSGFS